MRGVVSASKQVGVAPILSCKCTGCVTPGLVAWADHPPHPGPLDLLHPALGLLQNEMEVGRLLAPSSHHSPSPMDILVHAWVAREVCPLKLRFSWNLGSNAQRPPGLGPLWRWLRAPTLLRTTCFATNTA